MNKSNKYFWATFFSGGLILLGVVSLVVKNIQPAYQAVLEWCGLAAAACGQVINAVSPLNLVALVIISWFMIVSLIQVWQTAISVRKIARCPVVMPKFLKDIASQVGLSGRLVLVEGNVLFCSGFWRPQVVLGTQILSVLTQQELTAALAHESYHLRNRDPLKVLIVSVVGRSLFFLPAVSELARGYLKEKELAADLAASQNWGTAYLARALYKVLASQGDRRSDLAVASFAAERERILSLRGFSLVSVPNYWSWGISVFILTLLALSIFYRPALAVGGC